MKTKSKKLTALKVLSEMDKISREQKSPSMDPNYIVGTKFSDKTANGLTKAIIAFISLSGYQAERINNMGRMVNNTKVVKNILGVRSTIGSVEWQKGSGKKGTADISATVRGISVKIEVKIGRDSQSDDQKEYQMSITKAGGIYVIAKEFGDFVKWWVKNFGRPEALNNAIIRLTHG